MKGILTIIYFVPLLLVLACQHEGKGKEEQELKELIVGVQHAGIEDLRTELYQVELVHDNDINEVTGKVTSKEVYEILNSKLNSFTGWENNIRLVPDSVVGSKKYGLCTVSVGNIRKEARHSSELTSQLLMGHPVRILDRQEDWLQVQTLDRYIGWIDDGAIQSYDEKDMLQWEESAKVMVKAPFIFSRNPSWVNSTVSDLVQGDILRLLGSYGQDSLLVEYPDLRRGIVAHNEIELWDQWKLRANGDQERIAQISMEYLGIPYLWGGTSIKGLDCSGFTKTVFFRNGILLQRDASQQATQGTLVDREGNLEHLQKGDLLFFGRQEEGAEKIVHVGISLGNGKFIHASGDGYVKVNSLDSTSNLFNAKERNRYLFAKRYSKEDRDDNGYPRLGMYKSILYAE